MRQEAYELQFDLFVYFNFSGVGGWGGLKVGMGKLHDEHKLNRIHNKMP